MLKIGGKAPDFTLKSDDSKEVSLNDFAGTRRVERSKRPSFVTQKRNLISRAW
jgi:peroxiredoxin